MDGEAGSVWVAWGWQSGEAWGVEGSRASLGGGRRKRRESGSERERKKRATPVSLLSHRGAAQSRPHASIPRRHRLCRPPHLPDITTRGPRAPSPLFFPLQNAPVDVRADGRPADAGAAAGPAPPSHVRFEGFAFEGLTCMCDEAYNHGAGWGCRLLACPGRGRAAEGAAATIADPLSPKLSPSLLPQRTPSPARRPRLRQEGQGLQGLAGGAGEPGGVRGKKEEDGTPRGPDAPTRPCFLPARPAFSHVTLTHTLSPFH